jgi:hypothetical protein
MKVYVLFIEDSLDEHFEEKFYGVYRTYKAAENAYIKYIKAHPVVGDEGIKQAYRKVFGTAELTHTIQEEVVKE